MEIQPCHDNILLEKHIPARRVVMPAGKLVGMLSKKGRLAAALPASYYRDWGQSRERIYVRQVQTLEVRHGYLLAGEPQCFFWISSFRRFPFMENGSLCGNRLAGRCVARHEVIMGMTAAQRILEREAIPIETT